MESKFKMLDKIPLNKNKKENKVGNVMPRCAANKLIRRVFSDIAWYNRNLDTNDFFDINVSDFDFEFEELNKIKELNRRLREEELDFVSH